MRIHPQAPFDAAFPAPGHAYEPKFDDRADQIALAASVATSGLAQPDRKPGCVIAEVQKTDPPACNASPAYAQNIPDKERSAKSRVMIVEGLPS